ncbi:MAG: hypothetical protein SXG53_10600, partial [Pseudomonadota bacterium]|nr:hypothetical protein [Pseudomonadota bacterium]
RAKPILSLGAALFLSGKALALGAIVHLQGMEGDREAFFADTRVALDRTPMDRTWGPTSVKEIDVTAVYENAAKPEWVTLRLQFECPSELAGDLLDPKDKAKPLGPNDPVKFRIGPGSYQVKRIDLKSEPMAQSPWNLSSAPMLMKAGRIACNVDEFRRSIRKSLGGNTAEFDHAAFGKRLGKLGLPPDLMMIGQTQSNEFLDFAWEVLWWKTVRDGKRPDPSGKWSRAATSEERAAAVRRMEELQKQAEPELAQARASLEGNIAQMQAEFDFQDRAASIRKDRKLNKLEEKLIYAWVGRTEDEVMAAMGNPNVNEAGNQRFLHYMRYFDNTAQVVDMKSGAHWEEGNYSECNVEFVTMRDKQSIWRVADARVWIKENALGNGKAWCDSIMKAPK